MTWEGEESSAVPPDNGLLKDQRPNDRVLARVFSILGPPMRLFSRIGVLARARGGGGLLLFC